MRSLYVPIYIFCVVVSYEFFYYFFYIPRTGASPTDVLDSHTWIREIDIFIPVRKTFIMSITHIDNIGIPKQTKNTYDFLVQVRNFLLPLSLKVFRHKERDTPDFFIGPKSRAHPPQDHGELRKSTVFFGC